MEVLEARLRGRGTDSDAAVDRRLAMADRELEAIRFFDYAVINDDLDTAVEQMLEIITAERSLNEDLKAAARQRHGREQVLSAWLPGN